MAERTEQPGRDLISGIARGRTAGGEALPRTEIPSFIALLLVAGGETTDRALANFLLVLLQHPEALAAVRDDPDVLEPAFTEFMRRDGVVVYEDRELTADVEWHGVHLAPGQIVRMALISANNDETVFADPRRFDPARADLRLGKERRAGGRDGAVATPPRLRPRQALLHRLPARAAGDRDGRAAGCSRRGPRWPSRRAPTRALVVDWFHRYVHGGLQLHSDRRARSPTVLRTSAVPFKNAVGP